MIVSVFGTLVVLLAPTAALIVLLVAIDRRQRSRAALVASQIRLTDAIHAELGAIVAPVVERRAFGTRRVVFPVAETRTRDVARLVAITERVLGAQIANVDIVFTRRVSHAGTQAA